MREENRLQNEQLRKISEKLDKVNKNTEGLVEIFRASSGALKMFKWLGIVVGWVGMLATAIYAIVYVIFN